MKITEIPSWLGVWLAVGLVAFVCCLIPRWLNWPLILIPAFVFGSSVVALLVYGITRFKD